MKDYFCNKDSDTLHESRLFSFIPVFRFSQLEFSGLCAPFGSFWHFEMHLKCFFVLGLVVFCYILVIYTVL